jgi:hypothetical protein
MRRITSRKQPVHTVTALFYHLDPLLLIQQPHAPHFYPVPHIQLQPLCGLVVSIILKICRGTETDIFVTAGAFTFAFTFGLMFCVVAL